MMPFGHTGIGEVLIIDETRHKNAEGGEIDLLAETSDQIVQQMAKAEKIFASFRVKHPFTLAELLNIGQHKKTILIIARPQNRSAWEQFFNLYPHSTILQLVD
jgi:hypothetical protein